MESDVNTITTTENFAAFALPRPSSFDTRTLEEDDFSQTSVHCYVARINASNVPNECKLKQR